MVNFKKNQNNVENDLLWALITVKAAELKIPATIHSISKASEKLDRDKRINKATLSFLSRGYPVSQKTLIKIAEFFIKEREFGLV